MNDDLHREFVTPVRLGNGEILYKDFNFVYGPLPPYVNSWLIRLPFPNPFSGLRFAAAGLFLASLVFSYLICQRMGIVWLFGPIAFGTICWANSYVYNPTSFNAAYSLFFGSAATWCAMVAVKGGWFGWLGAGFALAGAFFSKPEGFFVATLAIVGALIHGWVARGKISIKEVAISTAGAGALFLPFSLFLFSRGLGIGDLTEGILQIRFQENLRSGFIEQYQYFYGMNSMLVIVAGVVLTALIFYLSQMEFSIKWYVFYVVLACSAFLLSFGALEGVYNDFKNLGNFWGGVLGFWWYKSLPPGRFKDGFLILWLSSFGGWLRPFFHVGAIVVPFRVGGGMLLASVFWFLMLPWVFKRISVKTNEVLVARNVLIICGLGVLMFGFTGLHRSWIGHWKDAVVEVQTPYGSFLANGTDRTTVIGLETRAWLKSNLREGRVLALSALPIELSLGWLPSIPISQIPYQLYPGDYERIIRKMQSKEIKYVLVYLSNSGYHFGVQNSRLAGYLDENFWQALRIDIPDEVSSLASFTPEIKRERGFRNGIIVFEKL